MTDQTTKRFGLLRHIPVLGRLSEVPADAIREARNEVITTTIFAAMPFWFPIIGYVLLTQPPSILESLRNGEFLIYGATLVGPLTYIVTKRYGRYVVPTDDQSEPRTPLSYPFPESRTSVVIAMILCIVSGIVITLQKIQGLPALSSIKLINTSGLVAMSVVVVLIATALFFCVSAYRNFMETLSAQHSDRISRAQQRDEDAFAAQWVARKEEQ